MKSYKDMSDHERFVRLTNAIDEALSKLMNDSDTAEATSEKTKSNKVAMISEIMDIRRQMGYEPSVKAFDRLYDLDLADLHQAVLVYNDELYEYKRRLPKTL